MPVLEDLVVSVDEDGDHVRVDPLSRQQRAQHPEEERQQQHFHFQTYPCRIHLKKEANVIYACQVYVCVLVSSSHLYR